MVSLSFNKWLSLLGEDAQIEGEIRDTTVHAVSIDTRTIAPGAIYFALKGENFDGHQFVSDAFQKGAIACVVQKEWPGKADPESSPVLVRVPDTLRALQTLAKNYRAMFKLPVVAITGTNGKTTTKEMTASVLEKQYNVIRTPGNLNNHIGLPLSLLHFNQESEVAVVEMGANHFGEIKRLCEIANPTHGMITNIGAGHLEFFGTVDDVAKAKAELFENLPEEGIAFVNMDDERVLRAARTVNHQVWYGFNKKADVFGEFLEVDERGCTRFRLQDKVDLQLQVAGQHQIYNALAAAAVGLHWQVSIEKIANALEHFTGFSKRMEWHELGQTIILLDAYNSNPDSLKTALETLRHIAKNRERRAIAVLGDMLELGETSESAHWEAGKWAAKEDVAGLFLYGDFASAVQKGYTDAGGTNAYVFTDKTLLAEALWQFLNKKDVILIKGSRGMAMESVWQDLQKLASD